MTTKRPTLRAPMISCSPATNGRVGVVPDLIQD
jgi:hypothetical protein